VETLKIDVASDLSGLTPEAMNELNSRVKRFAEDVIQQAAREEVEYRSPYSNVQEITSTHIIQADKAERGVGRIRRGPTKGDSAVAVIAAASSGGAGAFAGMLNSTWQAAAFGVFLGAGIIFTWIAARRS